MDVDQTTLKKISRDFRTISSRLLRSEYSEADDNLRRFLEFVERSPVILGFITPRVENLAEYDIEVKQDSRGRFKLPTDPDDEIAAVWSLLKQIDADVEHQFYQYASTHSRSGKLNDSVADFNGGIVRPFINRVISYLAEKSDEAEQSKSGMAGVMVNNYGPVSQQNLANQGSSIHAVNLQVVSNDLRQAAENLLQVLEDTKLPDDCKEELEEAATFVLEQSEADRPRKTGLKMYAERVKELATVLGATSQVYGAAMKLYTVVQNQFGQ